MLLWLEGKLTVGVNGRPLIHSLCVQHVAFFFFLPYDRWNKLHSQLQIRTTEVEKRSLIFKTNIDYKKQKRFCFLFPVHQKQ